MKTILIGLLSLLTLSAQAGTVCGINKSREGDSSVFSERLYFGEITDSQLVIIGKSAETTKRMEFNNLQTKDDWQKIDGQTIISFSRQENGLLSIAAANVTYHSDGKDLLKTKLVTSGSYTPTAPFSLVLLDEKLSIFCWGQ